MPQPPALDNAPVAVLLAFIRWTERTPAQKTSRFCCASGDSEFGSFAKRDHSSRAIFRA